MSKDESKQTSLVKLTDKFIQNATSLIVLENQKILEQINYQKLEQLAHQILSAARVFVVGEGRSGLVSRMLAMRIMHLGCQVYVIGETITPSINEQDLLIACSGSGTTADVYSIARKAKEIGARVACVTAQKNSQLSEISDLVIEINAPSKYEHINESSVQMPGSLFEQSTLLIFDALIYALSKSLDKSNQVLWGHHSNLE